MLRTLALTGVSLVLGLALVSSAAAGGDLFGKPNKADTAFLPVDQAFEIQPLEASDGQLQVSWRIAPGHYLYRQRLAFEILAPDGLRLGAPLLPDGVKTEDEYFGAVEIYRGAWLKARLPTKNALPKQVKLKVSYQGCAEAGLCYPPQRRVLELTP
jgi:thiol:disulfide interchange protein DsbD